MVTKASQATVTKSLMVTDTEIRIPMDIKTTDMANNLTDPGMDKTHMDPDMDKPLMDPDMDTNNLMVMVTDTVTNPTVMDIGKKPFLHQLWKLEHFSDAQTLREISFDGSFKILRFYD